MLCRTSSKNTPTSSSTLRATLFTIISMEVPWMRRTRSIYSDSSSVAPDRCSAEPVRHAQGGPPNLFRPEAVVSIIVPAVVAQHTLAIAEAIALHRSINDYMGITFKSIGKAVHAISGHVTPCERDRAMDLVTDSNAARHAWDRDAQSQGDEARAADAAPPPATRSPAECLPNSSQNRMKDEMEKAQGDEASAADSAPLPATESLAECLPDSSQQCMKDEMEKVQGDDVSIADAALLPATRSLAECLPDSSEHYMKNEMETAPKRQKTEDGHIPPSALNEPQDGDIEEPKKEQPDEHIEEPKNEQTDEPKFEVDDWVIDIRHLVSIVRIGYGAYAAQARVVKPHEHPNVFPPVGQ